MGIPSPYAPGWARDCSPLRAAVSWRSTHPASARSSSTRSRAEMPRQPLGRRMDAVDAETPLQHADCMSTMQIRNVPPEVSRALKARAAANGQSLSDYLLAEVTKIASRPTIDEMTERIARLGRSEVPAAAEILSEERSSR